MHKIVIVGAGLSGLAALRTLTQADADSDVILLEASGRAGGRTLVDAEGTDLGAGYIGPTQDRVMHLVDELGLRLVKVNTRGKTVQHVNGRVSAYGGTIPPLNPIALLDLNHVIRRLDALSRTVNLEAPHLTPDAEALDRVTAEQFLAQICWTETARRAMRVGVRVILCKEPCEISVLTLAWYVAQSGGVKRILETENGAQDSKVAGGCGQIAQRLARRYEHLIRYNCPVRAIDHTQPGFVRLTAQDGTEFLAQRVILAIPPVQQLRLMFTPALSPARSQSLQHWPMGHVIKTFMYYRSPFWYDQGLTGASISDQGIVMLSIDHTPADDGSGLDAEACIMGFILSGTAARWEAASVDERRAAVAAHYAKVFQNDLALQPTRYKEKNWGDEPWVGGCYAGVPGAGVISKWQQAHLAPIDQRIFIAGTEAAWRMTGYMDGAVEAGERIARNALVSLGALPASQQDQVSMPAPSSQLPFVPMAMTALERYTPSVPVAAAGAGAIIAASVAAMLGFMAR